MANGLSDHRIFRFPKPQWLNSAYTRTAGVHAAGALFSLALFTFIDAATFSKSHLNGSHFHVNFVDWIPGIFSTFGMLIINSIDKTRLSGDNFSYSGDGVAWKARVILFMGFAGMAGGLAGSVTVCVLKYVVTDALWPELWFGVANIVANALIMLSCVVLWVSQNMEDDYTYNLAL
ncbi:vacuolar sorting protein-like protein Vps68 [Neohortaea acidophila]|uniref:Vacuolar sorting protein-like protein Vps68 n=1 Tax=Neohortaea acidophila TaxID=245834 RepID=A0A6A6PI33_9PEZI|nr:vacuolar sorting protein-like protein Vps68 [Neohortaea acidophila]KAF2478927.1 vacuolar sorting protein-like protein Vps68 [Neohortaea acidophila]